MARNNNSFESNIINQSPPTPDISFVRENFGEGNTRNSLRGRSMHYAGKWKTNTHYTNDAYIVDFVSYENKLWACTISHLSKDEVPSDTSRYWQLVMQGEKGGVYKPSKKDGKLFFDYVEVPTEITEGTDIVYRPIGFINGEFVFQCGDDQISINAEELKWKLDAVTLEQVDSTTIPSVELVEDDKNVLKIKLPELFPEMRIKQNSEGEVILEGRVPDYENDEWVWQELGQVGIINGNALKLQKVTRDGEQMIIWGYDNIPINQWTKLCSLEDLRGEAGDQNIYIGCDEPEDKEQIWYDPCEDSTGEWSARDFLYTAYKEIGGTLEQSEFEDKFRNLSFGGSNIRFVDKLPEPSKDLEGYIYVVKDPDSTQEENQYNEYIIVNNDGNYKWELFGSTKQLIDLDNYYTKKEVDDKFKEHEYTWQVF